MLPIVKAIRDLGLVGKGGSGSHFFSSDNNKEYVVKFADNTKTVVNELVAGSLALQINLPSPPLALVNVSEELINLSTDLKARNVKAGLHIGFSRLSSNTADFQQCSLEILSKNTLRNADDLYGVICFDNWLLNTDRNNMGNNMIELSENAMMNYYMVDFGHCFLRAITGVRICKIAKIISNCAVPLVFFQIILLILANLINGSE